MKCVFLPLEAQPSEDFPPSALAATRNHTTYSWLRACEANCDFNHAARHLRLRSTPHASVTAPQKSYVVLARTRGFPHHPLAGAPANHWGATAPPARGRAPFRILLPPPTPTPTPLGLCPEPRWGFSTRRPPSDISQLSRCRKRTRFRCRGTAAKHGVEQNQQPDRRATKRKSAKKKLKARSAKKTPTPSPPFTRAAYVAPKRRHRRRPHVRPLVENFITSSTASGDLKQGA